MTGRPRICITSIEFPPDIGGVGRSVHRISRLLSSLGYEIHVTVFNSAESRRSEGFRRRASCHTIEREGIFVHRIQPGIRYDHPSRRDLFFDVYYQLQLLHNQYSFDVCHAFFINETGYVTALLAKENDLPVICSVRGNDLHKHIFSPTHCYQIVWALENAERLTFVSHSLLNRASALVPGIRSRSVVIWNSIEPIDFARLPEPNLDYDLTGVIIGSLGRFKQKKGLEFLIDACATLASEMRLKVLLVGDFVERQRSYWEQQIENSGIADQIFLTGLLSWKEAVAFLPLIDIFAIPSLHDGCPNALLEAMVAARPIIATRVDAIGEILEDGRDALLVNPASASELAEGLRRLALDPSLRQKLGGAAKETAIEHLAPSRELRQWKECYHRLLS